MIRIEEIIKYSQKLKLLYVEDDKEARETTFMILEEFFDDITIAIDGKDGIEKFRNDKFDLVITDINMPNMNGLDMAQAIRDIDQSIPIVIISAHNEENIFLRSIQIGVNGYLLKPINIDQLVNVLFQIVQKYKYIQQSKEAQKIANDSRKELEEIHNRTRDSIKYASLIQGALIPQKGVMNRYFKDHFVTWIPKDTVGGDIWLLEHLRHEDECLIMFIDCTGHGVPGAFVTMIVKAVEREIISKINNDLTMDVSPAWVMSYFNKTIKQLLRQETTNSVSNVGWDGGIIYYNRREQIVKFAGAETPLFYIDSNQEFHTIKGNRYSVGYKKCAIDYEYKETIIQVEEGMKFYCTTDGYLDQNGGEKDFPFGKKRFCNIIKKNHTKPMTELQTILQAEMAKWESFNPDNDRNDDMTLIAFEIGAKSNYIEHTTQEIIKYDGVITQNVIGVCMDNIESKISNMRLMGIISTITIEYCQNIMNYSKGARDTDTDNIISSGEIEVQNINNEYYEIMATNIVSTKDKAKIEPKLIEIQSLDKAGIKKRYKELRRSGENTHSNGGGIGMYEVAKISDNIEYKFKNINKDKYSFTIKSIVKIKKEKNEQKTKDLLYV